MTVHRRGWPLGLALLSLGLASLGCQREGAETMPTEPGDQLVSQDAMARPPVTQRQGEDTDPDAGSGRREAPPAEGVPGRDDDQAEADDQGLLDRAGQMFNDATKSGYDSARDGGRWMQDQIGNATESTGNATRQAVDWANQTFESLKSQGMTTATSTSEWLAEDWNNMESWEYRVVALSTAEPVELERELNRLGEQGWECFQVTEGQWVFKKRRESYLRRLPFKDVLRLAPLLQRGNQ